jgi:hypothetical protein
MYKHAERLNVHTYICTYIPICTTYSLCKKHRWKMKLMMAFYIAFHFLNIKLSYHSQLIKKDLFTCVLHRPMPDAKFAEL